MKKIILPFLFLIGLTVNAQLPSGSIAPDFTLTDINGVSHNLYTYLDQGKTVFIDVSATWCGPCWNYHNTHALEDLWIAHGPTGGNGVAANTTNDVIVLYIEGDASTTSADLNGTGSNTQGDWVTGVEHPIIDPPSSIITAFNSDYAIAYFPTIYKICPNRIIDEIGQASASVLYESVATCPPPASEPSDVVALSYKGKTAICGPVDYTPRIQIQNNGLDTLTEVRVSIALNGIEVSTGTYTGALKTYAVTTISCSVIPNFMGGDLKITVIGNGDADFSNNAITQVVSGAIETSNVIKLSLKTDAYASETSWKIKKATGSTVTGTTDPTLSNNTNYNFTYTLSAKGCYTFSITDSYGDGIASPGTINVRDTFGVAILNNTNFGAGIDVPFKVVQILGTAPSILTDLTISNQTVFGCEGTPVELRSSYGQGNVWSNGATSQSIFVTEPGVFTVTNNDQTSEAITVEFLTLDPVSYTEETANLCANNANITLTPGTPSNGYFFGEGVVEDVFSPATVGVGNYTIMYSIVSSSGCVSSASQVITVESCASIDENNQTHLSIYPNPSKDRFTIKSDDLTNYNTIEMIDQLGRVVGFWIINSMEMTIEAAEIANGSYTVIIAGESGQIFKKVQIKK